MTDALSLAATVVVSGALIACARSTKSVRGGAHLDLFGKEYELGDIEYAHAKGLQIPPIPAGTKPDAKYVEGLEGTISVAEDWIKRLRIKGRYDPDRYQSKLRDTEALLARARVTRDTYMALFLI